METVHMMEYLWADRWPEERAPRLYDISIAGKGGRFDDVKLDPQGEYTVQIGLDHPHKESLRIRAEIMPEPKELSDGGDYEPRPESIEGLIISADIDGIIFRAPAEPGEYRILVYVVDENNHAGAANIPFFVN